MEFPFRFIWRRFGEEKQFKLWQLVFCSKQFWKLTIDWAPSEIKSKKSTLAVAVSSISFIFFSQIQFKVTKFWQRNLFDCCLLSLFCCCSFNPLLLWIAVRGREGCFLLVQQVSCEGSFPIELVTQLQKSTSWTLFSTNGSVRVTCTIKMSLKSTWQQRKSTCCKVAQLLPPKRSLGISCSKQGWNCLKHGSWHHSAKAKKES